MQRSSSEEKGSLKKMQKNTGPYELYVIPCSWIIDLLCCFCLDDWQKGGGTFFRPCAPAIKVKWNLKLYRKSTATFSISVSGSISATGSEIPLFDHSGFMQQ